MNEPRLPPGHPPWEPLNGARIGGAMGLAAAAIIGATTSIALLPLLIGGAVVGAVGGYLVARPR